ncbi:D-xylulokinase [Treponema sp. R8-4-B8]
MPKPALLTIDIGTSTFKSALWDIDGNRLSFAAEALSVINSGNKHEAEPSHWLRAFETCRGKLLLNGQIENLASVEVIVISGNGPSLVPVFDKQIFSDNGIDVPADNARLWLDRRAVKYTEEVSRLMGGFVDAGFFLPKILSIKNDEIELYKKTKYFLGCPEYLAYALTGQARNVFPCDGFERWFWDNDVLDKLDLDATKMPAFIRPGEPFGTILAKTAALFGFSKNIPVISGGPDFFAAILGSGVTETGQACDRAGSSEGINLCTQNRILDNRLMSYGHPVKPYWNLSGIINTTGKAIDWACDLLGVSFDEFIALAKESKSGCGGLVFLPYLAGERAPVWNPSVTAVWSGINLASGRREFANSILESVGFAVRDVLSVMEETGVKAKQLRVTGKLAECSHLNQIKADITGIEVIEGAYKETELLGLAIIGSCFLGKFASYAEASSAFYHTERTFKPNLFNIDLYNNLFYEYKNIRDKQL